MPHLDEGLDIKVFTAKGLADTCTAPYVALRVGPAGSSWEDKATNPFARSTAKEGAAPEFIEDFHLVLTNIEDPELHVQVFHEENGSAHGAVRIALAGLQKQGVKELALEGGADGSNVTLSFKRVAPDAARMQPDAEGNPQTAAAAAAEGEAAAA